MARTPRRKNSPDAWQEAAEQILLALDVQAEYEKLGVRFTGRRPNHDGWLECYAIARDETRPSAAVNVAGEPPLLGRYRDLGGDGESLSLFDFSAKYGSHDDWQAARSHFSREAGVKLPGSKTREKPRPSDRLRLEPDNDTLLGVWSTRKKGIAFESLKLSGVKLARWPIGRGKYTGQLVVAMPGYGPHGISDDPTCWAIWSHSGKLLKSGPSSESKILALGNGWHGKHALERLTQAEVVWKVEGQSDLLALLSAIPPELRERHLVLTNSAGTDEYPSQEMIAQLAGLVVYVLHDPDEPGQRGGQRWAEEIARVAREVRHVRLPVPAGGPDLREWLSDEQQPHTYDDLLAAALEAETVQPPFEPPAAEGDAADGDAKTAAHQKRGADEIAFDAEATEFLDRYRHDGHLRLRYHRDCWLVWRDGCYREVERPDLLTGIVRHLAAKFERVTTSTRSNVLMHAEAQAVLSSTVEAPTWIDEPPIDWGSRDILPMRSELVHLPSLVEGREPISVPATPAFFCRHALTYDIQPDAPAPAAWLAFLRQLWRDDQDSIDTLQEWFGYLLGGSTEQQKILLMIGPPRSGKGTIARVLRAMLGPHNVAGPTLASLGENFGLSPLLGKSAAIVGDAQLSGRSDQAKIVERLLSISGEDVLTIDIKYREPFTCQIPARLMIITNSLPRLAEASGALANRILLLRLAESFLGCEDPALTTKLCRDLPGILTWAAAGWWRLRQRGYFVQPESGRESFDQLADLASPVGAFVRDRLTVDQDLVATIDELYGAWCEWCRASGRYHPGTKQTLSRDLAAAVPSIRHARLREGDNRMRAYRGVGVIPSW